VNVSRVDEDLIRPEDDEGPVETSDEELETWAASDLPQLRGPAQRMLERRRRERSGSVRP
jgi:hypothetical protein